MEVTKEQVDVARKDAEQAWTKFSLLKEAFSKAESDYVRKVNHFHNIDHELALIDGRLKKIPSSGQPELTLDQLKSIAEKLGFDLTEVDETIEEREEEEVDETSI